MSGTGLSAPVPPTRWRGELLQQTACRAAQPHELAWLYLRTCHDGSKVHHDRHAGQVSETGHRIATWRRRVPVHFRANRAWPLQDGHGPGEARTSIQGVRPSISLRLPELLSGGVALSD